MTIQISAEVYRADNRVGGKMENFEAVHMDSLFICILTYGKWRNIDK